MSTSRLGGGIKGSWGRPPPPPGGAGGAYKGRVEWRDSGVVAPHAEPTGGGGACPLLHGCQGVWGVHLRGCLCPCTGVPTRGGALGHPWGCVRLWGRDWVVLGGARLGMGGGHGWAEPPALAGGGPAPARLYWVSLGCTGPYWAVLGQVQVTLYRTRLYHTVPDWATLYRLRLGFTVLGHTIPYGTWSGHTPPYSAGSYHTVSYHTRCPPAPWHTAPSCVRRSHQ